MKPSTIRVHFEDKGQDLIHVDIEVFNSGDQGIITDVCESAKCGHGGLLLHKAILMKDMQPGKVFEYADPSKGFQVFSAGVKIEKIEEV